MKYSKQEIMSFIEENDVKFIRLAFCDAFGTQKNISIVPSELERAISTGISFDASSIAGFSDVVSSDLFLTPDLSTLSVLPWRPSSGRVVRLYCNIMKPDGTHFECDTRALLERVEKELLSLGYKAHIGTECEFYLFKTDENGDPTKIPHDNGGYLDMMPLDRGENVRREICFTLEEMGLSPESSHHESGPGQNEIDFKYASALEAADNFITFKYVVKAIAARNGLYGSFMPKPFPDKSGNGLHINISLTKNGENIFDPNCRFHNEAQSFIAGVLKHAREITAFLNPITNSYDRFGRFEAPSYVSWSHQNRSQLVRIPAASGDKMRMELRSPDSATNPYLAFSLILSAGLLGIKNGEVLPKNVDANLFRDFSMVESLEALPRSLKEALDIARKSEFVKSVIGNQILENFLAEKDMEVEEFEASTNREVFCDKMYFMKI